MIALYDPQRAERWMQLTGHDPRTVFLGWSAHWTWMLGYPDQAVQISNEKDAHARRLGHALNLGYALTVGAYAFDYRREPERLLERVREADRLAREQNIPILYQVMVPQVEGLARLRSGQLSESISLLRQGIENWNKLGGHTRVPYLKSALAEALALQGDLDAALEMIGECLEQIERPGWQERSHLAEVLRLKGWMLMRQGRGEEAETVCALRSTGRANSKPNPGSCAARPRLRSCCSSGASATPRVRCSPRSTTGSPKVSTRTISRRPARCWSPCAERDDTRNSPRTWNTFAATRRLARPHYQTGSYSLHAYRRFGCRTTLASEPLIRTLRCRPQGHG